MSDDVPDDPSASPLTRAAGAARERARIVGRRLRLGARRVWPVARWPVVGAGALFGLLVLLGVWVWFTTELPPTSGVDASAVVLDRHGEELAVLSKGGARVPVDLEELPDHVPAALIAAEDRRFYDHEGVDPIGVVRAVWRNVTSDELQGGSTITQQLVKNVYLDSDRTLNRKVREAVLAVKLERSTDKDQILQRYLNSAYFGRGAYGIEAAARVYFDTHAPELDVDQVAMLVGLLQGPESFDPVGDPEPVRERRDLVLDAMVATGALDEGEASDAKEEPIEVTKQQSSTSLTAGVAPHFVEQIRTAVIDRLGEEALYRNGLVIHTTLDLEDQRAAEAAVDDALDDPDDPQAAVVGIARSGAVRAWVGGRDFEELQVDLVSGEGGSGRQPGSTFKPVVLAANFVAGNGAGMRFPAPSELTLDVGDEPWTVENFDRSGYGSLTLHEATVRSVNTVYAQALLRVGSEAVADLATELGIDSPLEARPSIALGAEEVTPIELANVFSTFAREGTRVDPFRITHIENGDGQTLYERTETDAEEVVEPEVANTVSAVLSDVARRGTATRAALDRPMAAKTGTTQQNADAWLAGYTPEYTSVVWVGNAEGNEEMNAVDGARVFGGSVPATIWHDFMEKALEDVPATDFPEPDPDLLSDTSSATSLSASPSQVQPGETVNFEAGGLSRCVSGWQVVVTGPVEPFATSGGDDDGEKSDDGDGKKNDDDGETGSGGDDGDSGDTGTEPVRVITVTGPEEGGGSDTTRGSTAVTIPSTADLGRYRAELHCAVGSGDLTLTSTGVTVGTPPPSTTTTSSTTTSSSSSTSSTTSSTTTSSSSSTTSSSTSSTTSSTTTTTTEG